MEIWVRIDDTLPDAPELLSTTEDHVLAVLGPFRRRITSIEVHVAADTNGHQAGPTLRCQVEVRPVGHEPVVVTHHATTTDDAVRGATRRIRELLVSTFGRLDRRHPGAESIRRHA